MKTIITQVTLSDLADLYNISRETFKDTFAKDNMDTDMQQFLDTAYTKEKLTFELETTGTTFWFLRVDGNLAGYLKLNVEQAQTENIAPDALEVERIYIRKDYKHQGLGTLLINHAEKIAKDANKNKIWLGVWEHNEPAKHFYQKLGFKQIGEHNFQLGSESQRDLIMLKSL